MLFGWVWSTSEAKEMPRYVCAKKGKKKRADKQTGLCQQ